MRATIYALYSSDNQREASIEDQIEVCRRYAERQGWTVVEVYADRALSGASRFRSAFQQMQADAEGGRYDVILCEALDRLGRKLADVADLHDRLSFLRIGLHTVATGEVTAMHVGMLGTMAQMYLKDLAEKTRRGQLGRALQGKIPGGRAYGYDVLPATADGAGERRINLAEAAVIRRIFELFAAGASPRAIAKQLNSEKIPGPYGREWRDTTIRGQHNRGTGILNNSLYAGRLEWDRCAYVKDPRTGKRVARPNPRAQWEIVPVPDLRIVSDELWNAVKARQTAIRESEGVRKVRASRFWEHRRAQHLLTGLVYCGSCGSRLAAVGRDYLACSAARGRGTCANRASLRRGPLEELILDSLRQRLMAPELVEEFVAAFHEEVNRLRRDETAARAGKERELGEVRRKLDGLIEALAEGYRAPGLQQRLDELDARKTALERALAADPPPPVRLHPNLGQLYRRQVEHLHEALDDPTLRDEALEVLRGLVERVVLHPTADGLQVEIVGEIVRMVELGLDAKQAALGEEAACSVKVVAGAGFEPATFRL